MYFCAAVDKISTDTECRAVPLRQLSLLYMFIFVKDFKTGYNAARKFNTTGWDNTAHFWATVCKTVRPMLSVRCLSCMSCPVCDVRAL